MQKLLRRTPSLTAPVPTLSASATFSLPLSTTAHFISLGFHSPDDSQTMSAALRLPKHSVNPLSRRFRSGNVPVLAACRPCSCCAVNVNNGGGNGRGWGVRNGVDSRFGTGFQSTRTWFSTLAASSSSDSIVDSSGELVEISSNEGESEKIRVQQRRSRSSGGPVIGSPDLLEIPGVGPRNLRKLVEKGFEGVAQLKKLYKDKFHGKSSERMVEYLQSSVGIIHKNHAESITTYIKESVDEEDVKDKDAPRPSKKRITLCVEGNISVGKTTFLKRIANETIELRDLVEIVPEPIDKWQNCGNFNILDAFYAQPERYAYTFQNYVFVTRVMQERDSSVGLKPLRLMERSVFSDRMVFVRAVHEAKWMNEMEISIYDSWFDPVVSSWPGLVPDGFIYLRATPDTCHKRMMMRKREEEAGVSLDYLQGLHEKHESWLLPFESGNHGVLSVNKLPDDVESSLLPSIRDRVFYLKGDHMHSSIQKVPALVLDCEPDIDFSKDIEAKREYARQVAEFFEFVKKSKEVSDSKEAAPSNQPQVLLPHNQNLWMPGIQPLPESALNSFRSSLSFTP